MFKPKGFDSTREYGDFETLPTGNYICTIKKVEEGISKAGREKLMIYLDIAEGEYAGFFGEQYNRDTREEKKWPCVVHQLATDENGDCSRGLKTFITCVEHSNPGFNKDAIWGPKFCQFFRDKLVGAQFRREEYINSKGENKWSTKAFRFFSVDKMEEQRMPEDKPLQNKADAHHGFSFPQNAGAGNGFKDLVEAEGELPF